MKSTIGFVSALVLGGWAVEPTYAQTFITRLLGDDHFPSAAYATLDPAGDIHIAAEGSGPDDGFTAYKGFIGHPSAARWGDYGATAVDGNSSWIGSEYIGQTCTFAEFVSPANGPPGTCGLTRSAFGNWYTRISRIMP
jgi:hypothetical protein